MFLIFVISPFLFSVSTYQKADNMAGTSREPFQLEWRYADRNRFEKLNGPGDSRVTGQEIIKDENLVGALKDKVMLVTGVSSGMGVETVRALATTGATIYGCARNLQKAEEALGKELLDTGHISLLLMDQTDLQSVRRCAEEFRKKSSTLNVVINNAAVSATVSEQHLYCKQPETRAEHTGR